LDSPGSADSDDARIPSRNPPTNSTMIAMAYPFLRKRSAPNRLLHQRGA
jgi:hypothetical protein